MDTNANTITTMGIISNEVFLVPIILDGNAYNKNKNYSMNSQAGALELEKF
jgi:hypothetical protein